MPRFTEHRSLVAIVDEQGSTEFEASHGLVDLAAAVAGDSTRGAAIQRSNDAVYELLRAAVEHLITDTSAKVAILDSLGALYDEREQWVRYGARLGFALARCSVAIEDGFPSWLAAAGAWLERLGCGATAHVGGDFSHEISDLRPLAAQCLPAPDLEQGPATEKTIGDLVDRITAERIEDHKRRHHADTQAPAAEPTAPKTRPTVEERPRRAPAASRAATAPPMRHRALDTGHVAAAVPLLDQCAADDLELAGHRHPRAADPWFAQQSH